MPRLTRPTWAVIGAISLLFTLHYLFSSPSPPSARDGPITPARPPPAHRHPQPYRPARPRVRPPIDRVSNGNDVARGGDGLQLDARGYTTWEAGQGKKHPIELLIERARGQAKVIESRIKGVQSLEDAVEDYEKSFGMRPPKGFENWYKFTQSTSSQPHPAPLPGLYPLAHNPFLAYLSIPPSILRERVVADRNAGGGYFTLSFVPDGEGDTGTACETGQEWDPEDWSDRGKGRVLVRGPGAWAWRCNNTLTLLLPVLPSFPEEMFRMDPPLELSFSLADGPRNVVHHGFKERSDALGKALKVWPKGQLHKAEQAMRWTWGWHWTCPPDSPLKTSDTDIVLNDLVDNGDTSQKVLSTAGTKKTFIADFQPTTDVCINPELMPLHHILLSSSSVAAKELSPAVVACGSVRNPDIVGVPLDGVHESVDVVPWSQKTLKKVFWRGSATGLHHNKDTLWRQSQRERLHFFAHNETEASTPVLIDRGSGVKVEQWKVQELNKAWLDVGLSGGPVQCKQEDGTCDVMAKEINFLGRVRKEDATRYKFVIDVDGNGWSSRFRRLLAGNNIVLKSTLYPEWFSDTLIPWYHYVPVKLDYSDLYDILAFFMGAPDGSSEGRDNLAKEIAQNGLDYTTSRWRMEDMQSYTYLLILEYWRLMSDDRQEASYQS